MKWTGSLTPPSHQRSATMRAIRSKDTGPEMRVRRSLHAQGFRYRLHDRKLPGSPDIVLPKLKVVVDVRGCFWHGHACLAGRVPRANTDFWRTKVERNQIRDQRNDVELQGLGWRVFVVWECELESGVEAALRTLGLERAVP